MSMSMYMPADCETQPFRFADLPDCSSLLELLEFELVEPLMLPLLLPELLPLCPLCMVPVDWSGAEPVVLLPLPLLLPVAPPDEPVPELCAIMATQNANITIKVNKIRFTLILLGSCGPEGPD